MLPEASQDIAHNIVYFVTMVSLFIILRICLTLISAIADVISRLPIIGTINKIGGFAYGIIRGLIITYAVLMVISLMITINPTSNMSKMMDETYIAKTMMEDNIIFEFITNIS